MRKKICFTATAVLVLALSAFHAGSGAAAEFTAFGPVTFERQKGKPAVETVEFAGPAFGQDFVLKISNGDPQGKNRVSAATVTLNREQIAGPSDFNQQVGGIGRPVAPLPFNTLSVIAEGAPGSYLTVAVTGRFFEPSVTAFTASPGTVQAGQSATLSWSTVNAETCSIAPGIGTVPSNGSVTVTPAETTTFRLTAMNASGTTAADATIEVIHPAPTVSLSAAPESVRSGEPVTLSWQSSHAGTASIDPGVGSVLPNGSAIVYPTETTVYTVTVTGPGGSASAGVTVSVVSPVSLEITFPAAGASLGCPSTMVRGTVSNETGNETAVAVNGIPAIRIGDEFIANHVLVPEEANEIMVMAGDNEGNFSQLSIPVSVTVPENHFLLVPRSASGVTPFETDLEIRTSSDLTDTEISYTGPGIVDITETAAHEFTAGITAAGIYYLTAKGWDTAGSMYSDTIALVVTDPARLDALLRQKWEGMKTSLASGNIDEATEYFLPATRERYAQIFSAIGDDLPGFAARMKDIGPVYLQGSLAKYRIRRDETVNGEMRGITYYIHFSKGMDGLWYIESF